MSYRDFWNPRPKATPAQVRLAVGLAAADPAWAGKVRPLPVGLRPHPIFSSLTQGEIDLALSLMDGNDKVP
jgi:hypothetical protein